MKKQRWLMRVALSTLIFLSANGSIGYAQDLKTWVIYQKPTPAQSVNDELLKAAERAIAEAEVLRRVKTLKDEQIAALEGKIKALTELVEVEKARAEAYKQAASERATANALDAKQIALFEETVRDAKAEITRIRGERDSARRGGKILAGAALILGILGGVFAAK